MITILTSSPTGPLDGARRVEGLDTYNHFRETIASYWKEDARLLLIAADGDAYEENDGEMAFFAQALERSGLTYRSYDIWDNRKKVFPKNALQRFDVIFLGGGHVPTQNRFFKKIGLKGKLKAFDGLIIGISAGTMNAADVVYAIPELPGETYDPAYQRFISGLGLTTINVIPHYQMIKNDTLDGQKIIAEIAMKDSIGHRFITLSDGSYIVIADEVTLYGEAYVIEDGAMRLLNHHDEVRKIG